MKKILRTLFVLVALVCPCGATLVHAVDYTFDPNGAGTDDWWVTGNWTPGGNFPNSVNDRAIFNASALGSYTTNVHPSTPYTVQELRFATTSNWTVFNNERDLVLQAPSGSALVTQNGSGLVTVNIDWILGSNLTVGGSGNGNVTFNGSVLNGAGQRNGITGGFGLLKEGAFTLTLNPASSYAGGTAISGGTVVANNSSALGTGTITLNGGTLNTSVNLANAFTLNNNVNNTIAPNGNYRLLSGQISGTGGFTLASGGGTPGLEINNPANNFQGNVTINANTYLRLSASEVIPNAVNVVNNGNLRLDVASGGTETIAGLSGSGSVWVPLGNNAFHTLALGAGDASSTFTGTIGTSGQNNAFLALQKIGGGTITLSGNNLNGGTTTIDGGVLILNTPNLNTYSGGEIFINNGSTLRVTASGGANRYDFSGETFTFGATGGGTLEATNNVNFVFTGGNTIRTTGGAQNQVTGASGLNLNGNTVTFSVAPGTNPTSDLVVSTRISNTGNLLKTGTGVLQVTSTNNNYSGTTTVSGGSLDLTSGSIYNGAYNLSRLTVQGGSTLAVNSLAYGDGNSLGQLTNNTIEVSDAIPTADPTGAHLVLDNGTLRIAGASQNTSHGFIVTANGGTVEVANAATTVTFSGDDATGGGNYQDIYTFGQLQLAGAGNGIINDKDIRGTGSILKSGAGTWTLNGTNAYSGGTTVSAGTLVGGDNSAFGTAAIALGDANTGSSSAALLLQNSVDISNAVTVSNSGTGTAIIGTQGSGVGGNATTYSGQLTLNRATTLRSTVSDRLAIDGQITGNVGALTVDGGGRTTLLSTANNFVGNINITGTGTILQASVNTAAETIPNGSNINIGLGAFFQLAGVAASTETINALSGTGTATRNVAGLQTLAVGSAGGSGTFDGVIQNGSGQIALTKIGSGTQVFGGNNTYTGATNVNQGTLVINGTTVNQGNYNIASGARLGGDGTIGLASTSSITVSSSPGEVSPGAATLPYAPPTVPSGYTGQTFDATYSAGLDANTIGMLTIGGDVNMGGELLIDLRSPNPGGYDVLRVLGDFVIGATADLEINGEVDFSELDFFGDLDFDYGDRVNLVLADEIVGDFSNVFANQTFFDAGGHQILFGNDGVNLFLEVVPEPTSIAAWLCIGALGSIGAWRGRRKR